MELTGTLTTQKMLDFIHHRVSAITFRLMSLMSSKSIKNTKDYEEEITEYKLIKIEHPKSRIFAKREIIYPIISELPDPRWIRVGNVTNLYMYPLVSGKACDVDECQITFDEMYMFKKGELITWDRSFVVYNKKTKCIMTIKRFPELLKVGLSVKNNYITLETDKMPTLSVKLENIENNESVKCSYSCCKMYDVFPTFTCVDCGDEVAKWLCRFLDDKSSELRLGYSMSFVNPSRMYWQSWNGHESLFIGNLWNGHNLGPFINILPLETSSTNQISRKKKPDTFEIEDQYGMVYPTITISASKQHLERKWEWIKIGDLIVKVTQPAIIKGSNRTFDENALLYGLGVNSKLYEAGYVKKNDDIYIHFP
ncbi:mitochondrial amidoxime-reducing component 1-like [Odontomachus brunneus]|uniref:mitochondrial amidoxime-reducing component 1-like n=1 Tax=Odontomachus brunneus TaxID=486640 RepID=UPI0013F257FD|nr:mitochondrial amidoxime-reducing component 1-like [Odontomachus brunneus]